MAFRQEHRSTITWLASDDYSLIPTITSTAAVTTVAALSLAIL